MRTSSLILILAGLLLAWLSITGRLAVFLASVFTPSSVEVNASGN